MRHRRAATPGFSIFFFFAVIVFVFWFPFDEVSDVREQEPELTTTMGSEDVTIDGGLILDDVPMVPFHDTMTELEAELTWNEEENLYTAEREGVIFQFAPEDEEINVNGDYVELEKPVYSADEDQYLPLSFLEQTLDVDTDFQEGQDRAVIHDGRKEVTVMMSRAGSDAPELGEAPSEHEQEPEEEREVIEVNGVAIGDSAEDVEALFGEPERVMESHYGFDWHSYHEGYDNFRLIGMEDGEVTALYSNTEWQLPDGSMPADETEAREALGEPAAYITKGNTRYSQAESDEFDLFETEEGYLTVFYDVHQNMEVAAIQLIETETEQSLDGYYGEGSEAAAEEASALMFEVVNADRVEHGLDPLDWNDEVAEVAKAHSSDMAERNYFAHESPEGQSPFNRMREAGLNYSRAGENLASGQASAIFAQQGLMNSMGHRENLLSPDFEQLGVGADYGEDDRPFFTQKFHTP
ncbi:CAP-associated domain-containing protein [Alkalicoccus luteus]|uniref:Cysteine-rich secretory protein family protein n=1 Tax=Alkalicoccus luteus TaxID=1237094 RepID=A0A969TU39_9BACI|nr:CAP-associated domain-containing protein [Alkalicoccus luteus]NJP38318.1 hypothetical protein [Alkalicoccus luteus]